MKPPPVPANEAERLQALDDYCIMDTGAEVAFDALTALAAHITGAPIALVSLVDADRQWFKSRHGLGPQETPREISFCGHAIAADAILVVPDAKADPRFADNPLVLGEPYIRFYAGVPLRTPSGLVVGTLCVIDREPRRLTPIQLEMLGRLAEQVVAQLELRRRSAAFEASTKQLQTYRTFFDLTLDLFVTVDAQLHIRDCNPAWNALLGWTPEELRAVPLTDFVHPDDVASTVLEAGRLRREATPTVHFEHRFRRKDGGWAHLSWVASVKDDLYFASARDITSLRDQQAELARSLHTASDERSRLHSILSSANYAIIETTAEGRFREFNPAAERMLGYSAAEVIGRRPPMHLPAEVIARAAELTAELGTTVPPTFEALIAKARLGIADEREWTYVRKDGTHVPVELSITARRDATGEIVGYMGIAADITRRKEAERAMGQQANLLRLSAAVGNAFAGNELSSRMLDLTVEAIVAHLDAALARVWTLDETGSVLELQASAGLSARIDGSHARVPVGALKIGGIAQDRTPHLTNDLVGDPRIADQDWVKREGLVAFAGFPLVVEDRLIGVIAMFSRHPLSVATLAAMGSIAQTVAVGIDRRRVRMQLDEFKSTLDRTEDCIFIYDPATLRFSYANEGATRQLGYTRAELLKMTPVDLAPEFDELRFRKLLEPASHGEAPVVTFETTHRHKDGHDLPVEVVLQYVVHDGSPPRCVSVVRDIRERKRIDRMQSEFISTVSHELRTPLTSIRGSLGLVAGGVTGELPAEAAEYIGIALANSDRLVRLINDILDIDKMQAGKLEFRFQAHDLRAMLQHALVVNEPNAVTRHVRLRLTPELPSCEVVVDPDRFAQVLANLISNAVKFSPRGAVVEIGASHADDKVRVTVRDHGPGVPAAFGPRMFQRFAQADTSTTRSKGGTGLGLSISKSIVENMRGTIGFEAAPGGGTVFFVDLPYLPSVMEPPTSSLPRVLVCEDDPDVYRMVRRALRPVGLDIDVAPTVERARRLLDARRYVAMTLDLTLADGEATGLVSLVRANPLMRELPIIVVTGSSDVVDRAAILVSDVITKPFDEDRLVLAVRRSVTGCQTEHPRLLHVEDDPDLRRIIKKTLPADWTVVGAASLEAARRALTESTFDVVLLDLSLPDGRGEDLFGLVGMAQIIIFSAADASADLSRRVTAALVKTRSSSHDLRDVIVSVIARARSQAVRA